MLTILAKSTLNAFLTPGSHLKILESDVVLRERRYRTFLLR